MSATDGFVAMGQQTARVETILETARKSYYRVTGLKKGGRWSPGEVNVGATSVFICTTCKRVDCMHADAVRKFLAAQPLDRTATGGENGKQPE